MIVGHHDQRNSVALALSSDAPRPDNLRRPVFNWDAAGGLTNPDNQLMMGLLLIGLKPCVQLLGRIRRHETSRVGHPMNGSGRNGSLRSEQHRRRKDNSTN